MKALIVILTTFALMGEACDVPQEAGPSEPEHPAPAPDPNFHPRLRPIKLATMDGLSSVETGTYTDTQYTVRCRPGPYNTQFACVPFGDGVASRDLENFIVFGDSQCTKPAIAQAMPLRIIMVRSPVATSTWTAVQGPLWQPDGSGGCQSADAMGYFADEEATLVPFQEVLGD